MAILSWAVVAGLIILLAFISARMARTDSSERHDIGLAILDFGRAFPNEAIRSLHFTEDGAAVFVRLFDNKTGFMRKVKGHYACRVVEPGKVRVQALDHGRGLAVEFTDDPPYSGQFEFTSTRETAEVSLWLLGNYVHPLDTADHALPLRQA